MSLLRTTLGPLRNLASSSSRPISALYRTPKIRPQPHLRTFHASSQSQSLTNIFEAPEGVLPPLNVHKLTPKGYHLSDNLVVPGGLILLGGKALLWDVDPPTGDTTGGVEGMWKGWTKERFRIFEAVVPRPEILLFGTGESVVPAPKVLREYISGLGIQLDVMDSRNAASTFNLLSEEGRTIAAALCPLEPIEPRTGNRR